MICCTIIQREWGGKEHLVFFKTSLDWAKKDSTPYAYMPPFPAYGSLCLVPCGVWGGTYCWTSYGILCSWSTYNPACIWRCTEIWLDFLKTLMHLEQVKGFNQRRMFMWCFSCIVVPKFLVTPLGFFRTGDNSHRCGCAGPEASYCWLRRCRSWHILSRWKRS